MAEDEQPGRRVGPAASEMVGVLIGVASRHDGAHACGKRVEGLGAGPAQPEPVEHLAGCVAVEVPVEEHRSVAESAPGTGTTAGDVPVDLHRVGAEDLAHVRDLSCRLQDPTLDGIGSPGRPAPDHPTRDTPKRVPHKILRKSPETTTVDGSPGPGVYTDVPPDSSLSLTRSPATTRCSVRPTHT